jgi:hypothetical protein
MKNLQARLFAIVAAALLVPACGSHGGGDPSGGGEVEPGLSTSSLPPAPTGITAKPGDSKVTLSWDAVSGAIGYNVKGSTASGGPYGLLAVLFPHTTIVHSSLTNGVAYFYVVSAVNSVGEGPDSLEVSATPVAKHRDHDRDGDGEHDCDDK